MPYLSAQFSKELSPAMAKQIAQTLSDLTESILNKEHELTAVTLGHIAAEHWFIGGKTREKQGASSFYLNITAGSNTQEEKAHYIASVYKAIEEIIGPLARASYIVIDEVPSDAWGYQGQTQAFRYGLKAV
jgi:4-oxalocrotonate tautomerase